MKCYGLPHNTVALSRLQGWLCIYITWHHTDLMPDMYSSILMGLAVVQQREREKERVKENEERKKRQKEKEKERERHIKRRTEKEKHIKRKKEKEKESQAHLYIIKPSPHLFQNN